MITGTANCTDPSGAHLDLVSTCSGTGCGVLPEASHPSFILGAGPKCHEFISREQMAANGKQGWKINIPHSLDGATLRHVSPSFQKVSSRTELHFPPVATCLISHFSSASSPSLSLFTSYQPSWLGSPLNLLVSVLWGNPNKNLLFTEKLLCTSISKG